MDVVGAVKAEGADVVVVILDEIEVVEVGLG